VLNNDKCSYHEFYDFLLFYCLILLWLLDTCPALLPPPCSMHFSPLLCASAACLSHLLSPCCVHPLFSPHHSYMHVCHLSLSPSCCVYSLPFPLPQYAHPSCIFLGFCCAQAFSQQLLQALMNNLLCLPAFPMSSPRSFQSPARTPYPSLSLSFSYFHLFDILVPSLSLFAPPLSLSPLCTVSPILSDLFSQIDSTGKMFCPCSQRCASLHCKPFSTVSNPTVVGLICRRILASYQLAHRVKSPKTLSLSFSLHITALLGSFLCKAK